jgi:hypothetical protein
MFKYMTVNGKHDELLFCRISKCVATIGGQEIVNSFTVIIVANSYNYVKF